MSMLELRQMDVSSDRPTKIKEVASWASQDFNLTCGPCMYTVETPNGTVYDKNGSCVTCQSFLFVCVCVCVLCFALLCKHDMNTTIDTFFVYVFCCLFLIGYF